MATNENGEKPSDKKKTGNFEITIDEHKIVLTPPNRFIVQAAMAKMISTNGSMDMIGAGEIVYNSCKIKDYPEVEKDDVLLCSVFMKCFEIVEIKEATIKKI